jgi:hypothetical protein
MKILRFPNARNEKRLFYYKESYKIILIVFSALDFYSYNKYKYFQNLFPNKGCQYEKNGIFQSTYFLKSNYFCVSKKQ